MSGSVLLVELDPRATSLLLGRWGGASPIWSGSSEAAIQLVSQAPMAADAVVVADEVVRPLHLATRLQALDPDLAVVLITTPSRHAALVRAVAALVDRSSVTCQPLVDDGATLVAAVEGAVQTTRSRREHRLQSQGGVGFGTPGPMEDWVLPVEVAALRDLGQLLDEAPIGVVKTCVEGRLLGLNGRASELLERAEREAIGGSVERLLAGITRQRLLELLGARTPALIDRRRRDGRTQVLELTVSRAAGSDGFLLLLQDVTERVMAERSLRVLADASARLDATLDLEETLARLSRVLVPGLADACLVELVDDEGRCARRLVTHADADAGLAEAAGRLEGASRAAPVCDCREAALIDLVPTGLAEVVRDPRHRALLLALQPRSIAVAPIVAHGHTLGALTCLMTDARRQLTPHDLVLLEDLGRRAGATLENARLFGELQRADRTKDEFLAMLAHELRNPLAAIFTATQLLAVQRSKPDRVERARQVIDRQGRHLVRIVDDLLDVSRLTRGKIQTRREALDLVGLVLEVTDDFQSLAASAGVVLSAVVPPAPVVVSGDRTRLSQVLGNLLSNAVKFTERGGRVDVTLQSDGERARLEVRDDGIGLDPQMLRSAFEPFVQADRSLDRSRGGLGLGLAIVAGIVRLHGGRAEAFSEGPGKGTSLTVTLPLEAGLPLPALAAPAAPPRPASTSSSVRVLVVEDNADAAATLRELLEVLGHEVRVAESGPVALELARALQPEVVLCDLGLPGMNGFEVAARLRSDPRTRDARLVAVSGYGRDTDRKLAVEAGFAEHVTKPLRGGVLERILRDARAGSG